MRLLLILTSALSFTGCVSHWRGQEMAAEIQALEGRMDQQIDDLRTLRGKLQEEIVKVAAQLLQTERKLVESIQQLQSGSADNMLVIEKLREELNTARGELAKLEHSVQKPDGLPDVGAVAGGSRSKEALPEDPTELYRVAYEKKQGNDCPGAIRAFAFFAQKFPRNGRADNSLFLLAECQFTQKEYTGSIRTLQTVMNSYSKGDKIDDALVLMHDNFVALGRCKDALPFLETLIDEYPRSNQVKIAKRKLKRTKKSCR